MKADSSIRSVVAASLIPRLNSTLCLPLIERCGGIEGFFWESDAALQHICREMNISARLFDRSKAWNLAEAEMDQIDRHNIQVCTIEDDLYPELLKQCEDVPLVLFYKGDIRIPENTKCMAIVGTRRSSAGCRDRVEIVLSELCAMGCYPVVVSGLAYGIDASAHRASLKLCLRTFAVLGHGLHMIYPASHKALACSIVESGGALISEFPCTSVTHPGNFLKRNRIIAGLCHVTLVAESAERGGAMSTASQALSYNRDVVAFAGRPDDTYSAGCNRLIKENVAALVDNGLDVARILNYPIPSETAGRTVLDLFPHDDKSRIILELLEEKGDTGIDELSVISRIPQGELSALLLELELEQKVLALPGKRYAVK